jgi:uncharacterized membrane protein
MDATILLHWAEFAVRWLHVITAIAWIGSSFYFIALDLGLNRNIPGPADGEEWQVHGGGLLPHPEIHGGARRRCRNT